MQSERRAGQVELLEKVTRMDERVLGLCKDMTEVKKDVKSLRMWVNIGRGAVAAAVTFATIIGGWIGFNGMKSG